MCVGLVRVLDGLTPRPTIVRPGLAAGDIIRIVRGDRLDLIPRDALDRLRDGFADEVVRRFRRRARCARRHLKWDVGVEGDVRARSQKKVHIVEPQGNQMERRYPLWG